MSGFFNIRVYGICINDRNELLLSNEEHEGRALTKFPGGGLEQGEGTLHCLKREFGEEFELDIEIERHFYTTDFFQPSAFNASEQVISIYYFVHLKEEIKSGEGLFWKSLDQVTPDDVTFPIDKIVVEKILNSRNT